jgi:peptide/nickel transport system substrate-binding protein
MLTRKHFAALAALLATGTSLAACQSASTTSTQSSGTSGVVQQLVLPPEVGTAGMVENFNPYSGTQIDTQYMFGSLYAYNDYTCQANPWLASSSTWQNPKTLTVTIRSGVKWSDGSAFTAADVAYTYNLLKRYPALDTNALWTQGSLASVSASGSQVTFTFSKGSGPVFQQIVTTPIIPQSQWSKVANPVTFTNTHPVVTGPFMPKSFTPQQVTLTRDPDFWQASKVKVASLIQQTAPIGTVVNLQIANGEIDQGGAFIPDIQKTDIAKDPAQNHYWFPPGGAISFFMNLTKAPFNDVAFRRAMTYAIDRNAIAQKAEYGYVTTASQTGLILPGQASWLAPGITNNGDIGFNTATAQQMLTAAGYKKSGNTLLGKNGKPVAFTFLVQAGYSDWIQAAQIIQADLAKLGITMSIKTEQPNVTYDDQLNGNYDAGFGVAGGSCNMYVDFADPLASAYTAPIGKAAVSNWIRWKDPATDALVAQLQATPGTAQQKAIVTKLENIMVTDVPYVPLWYGAEWFEYSTRHATGWPDAANPYASPGDVQLIYTHLRAAG